MPFAAGDLKVVYRPNSMTTDAVSQITAAMSDPEKQTDGLFVMIAGMLESWDLEDDNGEVIPVSDEKRLRAEVPMGVFGKIFTAMRQDQNPGEANGRS